jgi:hypothetical protein
MGKQDMRIWNLGRKILLWDTNLAVIFKTMGLHGIIEGESVAWGEKEGQ